MPIFAYVRWSSVALLLLFSSSPYQEKHGTLPSNVPENFLKRKP